MNTCDDGKKKKNWNSSEPRYSLTGNETDIGLMDPLELPNYLFIYLFSCLLRALCCLLCRCLFCPHRGSSHWCSFGCCWTPSLTCVVLVDMNTIVKINMQDGLQEVQQINNIRSFRTDPFSWIRVIYWNWTSHPQDEQYRNYLINLCSLELVKYCSAKRTQSTLDTLTITQCL